MMAGAEPMRQIRCARSGLAQLTVSEVAGQSVATHSVSRSPLKLLVPQPRGAAVWAYLSSFGGGLLAGDSATINVEIEEGARAFLTSQASTKVYTSPRAVAARQDLACVVSERALLAVVPDAVQCYAASVYEQRQTFQMTRSSGLVFVDALSAGRTAREERWAFTKFFSRTELFVDEERACLDALLLDNRSGSPPALMGRFNAFATLLVAGELLAAPAQKILAEITAMPVRKREPLVVSASPIRHGIIVRLASERLELLTREIHRQLGFLGTLLGDDPLARKW